MLLTGVLVFLFCMAAVKAVENKPAVLAAEVKPGLPDVEAIIRRVLNRDDGHSSYSKSMILSCPYEEKGDKKTCTASPRKKMTEGVSKDVGKDGKDEISLMIILEPASEKGMVFLQESYDDDSKDTEQSMYLPALKKMKRIVSESGEGPKTGSLFGSEFSYEDMEKVHFSDFTYSYVKDEVVDDANCYVIEEKPTDRRKQKSSYRKIVVWIDKAHDFARKIEMYHRNDELVKTLYLKDYEELKGIFVPKMMVMANHEKRRMSLIKTLEIKMNPEVPSGLFELRALEDAAFRESLMKGLR